MQRPDGENALPVERVLDRIPDGDWDVSIWRSEGHMEGRLDVADRRRVVERVLSEAALFGRDPQP